MSGVIGSAIHNKLHTLVDERLKEFADIPNVVSDTVQDNGKTSNEANAVRLLVLVATLDRYSHILYRKLTRLSKYRKRWRFPGSGFVNHTKLQCDFRLFWNRLSDANEVFAGGVTKTNVILPICEEVFGKRFSVCKSIDTELSTFAWDCGGAVTPSIVRKILRRMARKHRHTETSLSTVVAFVLCLTVLLYVYNTCSMGSSFSHDVFLETVRNLSNGDLLQFFKDKVTGEGLVGSDESSAKRRTTSAPSESNISNLAVAAMRKQIYEELHDKIVSEAEKKIREGRWRTRVEYLFCVLPMIVLLGRHEFKLRLFSAKLETLVSMIDTGLGTMINALTRR